MPTSKLGKRPALIIIILTMIIALSGALACSPNPESQPIEISLPPSKEFLAAVNPRLAVISVGADNKFGHPCPEVMERLKEKVNPENIYRTDEHGTVEFITDGERLWVKPES